MATISGAIGPRAALALDLGSRKRVPQRMHGFEREIAPIDLNDSLGFGLVDNKLAVFDVIAKWRHATHPQALFLRCGDLVADPFTDDLALELGKGQKHVQRQPAHAGRGVELLGDRHKRDAAAVKDLDELGKIGERARQPVDLVDNDDN